MSAVCHARDYRCKLANVSELSVLKYEKVVLLCQCLQLVDEVRIEVRNHIDVRLIGRVRPSGQ